MRKIGRDISAADWWAQRGDKYLDKPAYHAHRMHIILEMMPELTGGTFLDFGCGDGMLMREVKTRGVGRMIGIEPSADMLARAADIKIPSIELLHGALNALPAIQTGSVNCFAAINVLGYLSDEEEQEFYAQVRRILKVNGHLLVAHSNSLFDLFTLNAFTADFFSTQFGVETSSLLARPNEPDRPSFNIRENPLSYQFKLAALGFTEERQEFMNFHEAPPLLMTETDPSKRQFVDTLAVACEERWKLQFRCSMFASLSRRN